MSEGITNEISGLSAARVRALIAEAEKGYDAEQLPAHTNPHLARMCLVPQDLLEAIDERALRDGQTPDAVVRSALAAYLHSA